MTDTLQPAALRLAVMLDAAAAAAAPLPVRFACVAHAAAGQAPAAQRLALVRALSQRVRAPGDCRQLAELAVQHAARVHQEASASAAEVLSLLVACDALRRPERFELLLQVCALDASAASGLPGYPAAQSLRQWLGAARSVDTATVAARAFHDGLHGPAIGQAVRQAQQAAIEHARTRGGLAPRPAPR